VGLSSHCFSHCYRQPRRQPLDCIELALFTLKNCAIHHDPKVATEPPARHLIYIGPILSNLSGSLLCHHAMRFSPRRRSSSE